MEEFRNRVLKPAALPLGAAVFIGVLVFSFSRILLAVPEFGSTSLALLMAAEVLAVAAVLAATRKIKAAQRSVLIVTVVALIGGGVASAQIGVRPIEHEAEEVHIAAENIEFDTDTLTFPADSPVELVFENNDNGVPHNVSIWNDDTFTPPSLFTGETFNGVATRAYEIEPLETGEYAFRCDVHPQMLGTVVVGEGGGEPEPGGADEQISAENIEFDKDTLSLPADAPTTIEFENLDEGIPHNVAIYADDSFDDPLFEGEIFAGVETMIYEVPPISAGAYPFQCDVHPNMNGMVTFS
jgi:plastocyanin